MKSSQKLVDLVKSFEGLRLEPYKCSAGVPTIGYGTTKYPNGVFVGMQDPEITAGYAEQYLKHDLGKFEAGVTKVVTVPLSQNQFDALVSFSYNLGLGALKGSTLLKLLNAGKPSEAAKEFPRWNKAGGKELAGLTKRRLAEQALFLAPY